MLLVSKENLLFNALVKLSNVARRRRGIVSPDSNSDITRSNNGATRIGTPSFLKGTPATIFSVCSPASLIYSDCLVSFISSMIPLTPLLSNREMIIGFTFCSSCSNRLLVASLFRKVLASHPIVLKVILITIRTLSFLVHRFPERDSADFNSLEPHGLLVLFFSIGSYCGDARVTRRSSEDFLDLGETYTIKGLTP